MGVQGNIRVVLIFAVAGFFLVSLSVVHFFRNRVGAQNSPTVDESGVRVSEATQVIIEARSDNNVGDQAGNVPSNVLHALEGPTKGWSQAFRGTAFAFTARNRGDWPIERQTDGAPIALDRLLVRYVPTADLSTVRSSRRSLRIVDNNISIIEIIIDETGVNGGRVQYVSFLRNTTYNKWKIWVEAINTDAESNHFAGVNLTILMGLESPSNGSVSLVPVRIHLP